MKRRAQAAIDSLERQGIAVDTARITSGIEENLCKVHLRFDRVALRFVDDVQLALHEVVPDGHVLVFTITAPLRLASKTAKTLTERARRVLPRQPAKLDLNERINGNQIHARLVKGASNGAKVIGFVHNPDCDPEILFDATQSLLRSVA